MKKISVIVVTHNRPKDVMDTLVSLQNQSVKPFEIIVIDDASDIPFNTKDNNENVQIIRFNKEVGASRARNYGIKISTGEYLAFIDDDAVADANWLEEIQKGITVGADVLGGPLEPLYEANPPEWWNEKAFGHYVSVGNSPKNFVDHIWGANMIIKREVLRKIGLFRSDVGPQNGMHLTREDTDLVSRAKRKGYRVAFMSKAVVYHKVKPTRMTFRHILRWEYYQGKSFRILYGSSRLRTFLLLYINVLAASANIIFSMESVKRKRFAHIAFLLGQLN